MAFDAEGNYSPPDQATPHVLVATTAFVGQFQRGGKAPVAVGQVIDTATLGFTNIAAGMGPKHPMCTLIEHPTAKLGDVLAEADVAAGIATAAAKLAAVAKFKAAAAEAAKNSPPKPAQITVGSATLTEADITALKKMLPASAGPAKPA